MTLVYAPLWVSGKVAARLNRKGLLLPMVPDQATVRIRPFGVSKKERLRDAPIFVVTPTAIVLFIFNKRHGQRVEGLQPELRVRSGFLKRNRFLFWD